MMSYYTQLLPAKSIPPVSPVLNVETSSPKTQMSLVRDATMTRLAHMVQNPNTAQNIISAGKPRPEPTVTNPAVVSVGKYEPLPGNRLMRRIDLTVANAPGPQVDKVADAIQRYLNITPRYEPTADPKAEASTERHPMRILQAREKWEDIFPYQFAINGVPRYQKTPDFYLMGGSMKASVEGFGLAGIQAPPTESPEALYVGRGLDPIGHPPAFAAQMTMKDIQEMMSPDRAAPLKVGPKNLADDSDYAPANVLKTAMRIIDEKVNGLTFDDLPGVDPDEDYAVYPPTWAARLTMERLQQLMNPDKNADEPLAAGAKNKTGGARYGAGEAGGKTAESANPVGAVGREFPLGNPAHAAARALNTYQQLVNYRSPVVVGSYAG